MFVLFGQEKCTRSIEIKSKVEEFESISKLQANNLSMYLLLQRANMFQNVIIGLKRHQSDAKTVLSLVYKHNSICRLMNVTSYQMNST